MNQTQFRVPTLFHEPCGTKPGAYPKRGLTPLGQRREGFSKRNKQCFTATDTRSVETEKILHGVAFGGQAPIVRETPSAAQKLPKTTLAKP
jgi:hypothetical protein